MGDSLNALIAQGGRNPQQGNMLSQMGEMAKLGLYSTAMQKQQFDLQQAKLQPAYSSLAGLMGKSNVSADDITAALANAHRLGANTDPLQEELTTRLAAGESPGDIRTSMWLRGQSPAEQAALALPTRTTQNVGGQMLYGTVAPPIAGTGAFTPAGGQPTGAVPLGPSPGEQQGWAEHWNQQVSTPVQDENGNWVTTQIPLWKQQGYSVPPPYPGAGAGAGGGGGPGAPRPGMGGPGVVPPGYTGGYPGTGGGPGGGAGGAGAGAGGGGPPKPLSTGTLPTSLPGTTAPELTASADAYNRDTADAGTFTLRTTSLRNGIDALAGADTGGATAAKKQQWAREMVAMLPDSFVRAVGIDPQKVTDYDEAKKYFTQYASTLGGAGRSDQALATALTGNPNVDMNKMAATDVAKVALGLQRMKQATTLEFASTHPEGSGGQYNRWLQQQNQKLDPRAFAFDLMEPQQKEQVIRSLKTPQARQNWEYSMGLAERNKVQPPQAVSPGG